MTSTNAARILPDYLVMAAKHEREPLLVKVNDFSRADIEPESKA